jgi:hypothetical protein
MTMTLLFFRLLLLALLAPPAPGAATPAKALLTVESIAIQPASPGPDTLCRLTIRVKNAGPRKASYLAFAVRLNGEPVEVYKRHLYLQTLPPGAATEVRLFNFWTTETGRPVPKDRTLRIEVALTEARWVEVRSEGGAEVVKPAGPVLGLPVSANLAVPLKAGS